jgi:hypothetical protein
VLQPLKFNPVFTKVPGAFKVTVLFLATASDVGAVPEVAPVLT